MEKNGHMEDIMMFHQLLNLSRYHAEKHLSRMGLKPGQIGIMFILSKKDGQTGRQLASKMGITPPSMTVAIQKLEHMGYVQKVADDKDQRRMHIFLTDSGRECLEKLKQNLVLSEDRLYRGISTEERLLFRRLLVQMRDNLMDLKEFEGMDVCEVMKKTWPNKVPPPPSSFE